MLAASAAFRCEIFRHPKSQAAKYTQESERGLCAILMYTDARLILSRWLIFALTVGEAIKVFHH